MVGMPVEGPPRWMSPITTGTSDMMARPISSCIREMPGPAVQVMDLTPVKEAPITVARAEISSSAWYTVPFTWCIRSTRWLPTLVAGVMG